MASIITEYTDNVPAQATFGNLFRSILQHSPESMVESHQTTALTQSQLLYAQDFCALDVANIYEVPIQDGYDYEWVTTFLDTVGPSWEDFDDNKTQYICTNRNLGTPIHSESESSRFVSDCYLLRALAAARVICHHIRPTHPFDQQPFPALSDTHSHGADARPDFCIQEDRKERHHGVLPQNHSPEWHVSSTIEIKTWAASLFNNDPMFINIANWATENPFIDNVDGSQYPTKPWKGRVDGQYIEHPAYNWKRKAQKMLFQVSKSKLH